MKIKCEPHVAIYEAGGLIGHKLVTPWDYYVAVLPPRRWVASFL